MTLSDNSRRIKAPESSLTGAFPGSTNIVTTVKARTVLRAMRTFGAVFCDGQNDRKIKPPPACTQLSTARSPSAGWYQMIPLASPGTHWQFRKRHVCDVMLKLPLDGQWNRQLAAYTDGPPAMTLAE